MIKQVATTFADAVRLAQSENHDYWEVKIEAGKLREAAISNRVAGSLRESIRDQNRMHLCTRYGRNWQVDA